jgi:chemotaxis protein CheZ
MSAAAFTLDPQDSANPSVHLKIGILTRQLHDSLQQLGLTEKLQVTAQELPDVKSRLSYISRLTGEAAEKVLNRVDQAKTEHEKIHSQTRHVSTLLAHDPAGTLANGHLTHYLDDMARSSQLVDQHLTDIMMAQDFHDLTGQVIKRVVSLAATIEEQLVELLIQTAPAGATIKSSPEVKAPSGLVVSGPVIDKENAQGAVTNQSEVDDLLASLGF